MKFNLKAVHSGYFCFLLHIAKLLEIRGYICMSVYQSACTRMSSLPRRGPEITVTFFFFRFRCRHLFRICPCVPMGVCIGKWANIELNENEKGCSNRLCFVIPLTWAIRMSIRLSFHFVQTQWRNGRREKIQTHMQLWHTQTSVNMFTPLWWVMRIFTYHL